MVFVKFTDKSLLISRLSTSSVRPLSREEAPIVSVSTAETSPLGLLLGWCGSLFSEGPGDLHSRTRRVSVGDVRNHRDGDAVIREQSERGDHSAQRIAEIGKAS